MVLPICKISLFEIITKIAGLNDNFVVRINISGIFTQKV
jgi:hypothetical protein